jgi:tripartite-type tricarboxylate transporter receptor subunit TctC
MFAHALGIQMTHVPYKGSAPMLTDLLAGQLQLSFSSVPTALPHIRAGRLRALAVTRPRRSATLPDLPTVQEATGVERFEISLWQAIVAPRATPGPIVARLNAQIVASIRSPELKSRFAAQGLEVVGDTPQEFAAYLASEIEKWTRVVKASGARIE